MALLVKQWERILGFVEIGGSLLWALFAVIFVMLYLIVERYLYFWFVHPIAVRVAIKDWTGRSDHESWHAKQIRRLLVSQVTERLSQRTIIIKALVSVCPLLGLLGTVVGMMEIFRVMAVSGNENFRAMAAGVYKAIISTMVGMVAALAGLYFSERLSRLPYSERRKLEERLQPGAEQPQS